MRTQLRPWHLGAALIAVCLTVLGVLSYFRSRGTGTPTAMVACLPRSGAVTVYLDIGALRQSGLLDMLAGSKAAEDLEYQQFVDGTGFDYRRDVESLAGAFSGRDAYLAVRGKFDWKKVDAYATARGGTCRNTVCRVPVAEGRFVSFYPMRPDVMAIAFSKSNSAALDIAPRQAIDSTEQPDQPIWISVSGTALRGVSDLPSGAKSFVSPLESAEQIILSAGAEHGDKLQLNLNVQCASESAAGDLLVRLEGATNMLRKMLDREKVQPSRTDLSGMLTAGTFRREQRRVYGTWPLYREFVASLASGTVR